MTTAESISGGGGEAEHAHVVELVATAADSDSGDQITPFLTHSEKPKIDIFSVSYSRRKPNRVFSNFPPNVFTSFYSSQIRAVLRHNSYIIHIRA